MSLVNWRIVIASIFALLCLHVFFYFGSSYGKFPWLDVVMHIAGGAIAGAFFALFFANDLEKVSYLAGVVFWAGMGALAGVFWEGFEWCLDHYLYHGRSIFQPNLDDTLIDLMMGIVGSVVFALLYKSSHKTSPK